MINSTTTSLAPAGPGLQPPSPPACRVPFHRPALGLEEEQEVIDTLRCGWLTTGPKTKRFEQQFAEYPGARHASLVESLTGRSRRGRAVLTALGIP